MLPLGDSAVYIQLGDAIDPETHRSVRRLCAHLEEHPFEGMTEYVPSFTSVTVYYDVLAVYRRSEREAEGNGAEERTPYAVAAETLGRILASLKAEELPEPETVDIPVCYGGEFGPDLDEVAARNGLTPDEVVRIHASAAYTVYMIGFAPGFPYLGGMSKAIAAPRRGTPRLAIPAGSVGIAGEQTGVYPIETPGGWQLIGRTPKRLFLPDQTPPSLLRAGQVVRFVPIDREEYERREANGR